MKLIKREGAIYMMKEGTGYEIQNQNPPNGEQYSRIAKKRAEAEKIYQEELKENESNQTERKKMAKKKKAKSKRRKSGKATAAQLRALRKARAAAARKRRGKKARRSSRPKARKHKRPIHHKSPKRKAASMARKRKGGRRRGHKGGGGKQNIMQLATKIGIGAAGAVGGALIARQIPVDAKIKPIIPIAAGIGLAMFIRNPMAGYAGVGMAIAGLLASIKTFAPNIPMLAGVDDEELIYADGAAPGLMYNAPRVLNGVPVEYANGVPVEYANGDQDLVDVLQGY